MTLNAASDDTAALPKVRSRGQAQGLDAGIRRAHLQVPDSSRSRARHRAATCVAAVVLLSAACGSSPRTSTPESAPAETAAEMPETTTAVQAPVTTFDPRGSPFVEVERPRTLPIGREPKTMFPGSEVQVFAYGEGGDPDTAAVAGARIAIIDDPQAWWNALRDDAPDHWEALPPGYRVQSTVQLLASAPAQWVTTGADGTAVSTIKPEPDYLYCAVSPAADDIVAGCTQQTSPYPRGRPVHLPIYFSGGRAYFMTEDSRDGSVHYEQYQLRRNWPQDPVRVVFVNRYYFDYGPEPEYFESPWSTLVVIHDTDVGAWWDTVSQDGELALSSRDGRGQTLPYTAVEWGGSHYNSDAKDFRFVRLSQERFESSPARYPLRGTDYTAEAFLVPGDYLFCAISSTFPTTIDLCAFADILPSQGTVIEKGSAQGGQSLWFEVEREQDAARTLIEVEEFSQELAEPS